MSIQNLATSYGVYTPEDLSFLQGIYDEVCAQAKPADEMASKAVARRLLVLFNGGTRDRDLLRFTASRVGRQPKAF